MHPRSKSYFFFFCEITNAWLYVINKVVLWKNTHWMVNTARYASEADKVPPLPLPLSSVAPQLPGVFSTTPCRACRARAAQRRSPDHNAVLGAPASDPIWAKSYMTSSPLVLYWIVSLTQGELTGPCPVPSAECPPSGLGGAEWRRSVNHKAFTCHAVSGRILGGDEWLIFWINNYADPNT